MKVIEKVFGLTKEKEEVHLYRITNTAGSYVELSNYGATIVSIVVPNRDGVLENVVLNYNSIDGYLADSFYLGATIGRVANRISGAKFFLNDETYQLDKNDGENSNHGGLNGFNKKIFFSEIKENSVVFSLQSPDGEGGFPGNLNFSVKYSFSEDNMLQIEYVANSDKVTPVNFTNHSYFNLGKDKDGILGDFLNINARKYLESNDLFLPTGKVLDVKGSTFDFNFSRSIGQMIPLKRDNMKGYNTFFVKDESHDESKPLASLFNKKSGRIIDLYTSMSGVLIYTAEYLSGEFKPFDGVCLEAQYHPDALSHPSFPKNILQPNEEKIDVIKYHFRCEN